MKKKPDPINPSHYKTKAGIEAVDVLEAFAPNNIHRANSLKYLLRGGRKGPVAEDLRKAIWWIQRELDFKP